MAADSVSFDGPWAALFDGYVASRRDIGLKVGATELYRLASFCESESESEFESPPISLTGGYQAASGWLAYAYSYSHGLM